MGWVRGVHTFALGHVELGAFDIPEERESGHLSLGIAEDWSGLGCASDLEGGSFAKRGMAWTGMTAAKGETSGPMGAQFKGDPPSHSSFIANQPSTAVNSSHIHLQYAPSADPGPPSYGCCSHSQGLMICSHTCPWTGRGKARGHRAPGAFCRLPWRHCPWPSRGQVSLHRSEKWPPCRDCGPDHNASHSLCASTGVPGGITVTVI